MPVVLMTVVVVVNFVAVTVVVAVRVPVSGQTPEEKADAGQDQDAADDVALLGLDLLLEAEPDESDHSGEDQRCEDVAGSGQGADPGYPEKAPALGAADDREGHPVVGKDGMNEAHDPCRDYEEGHRTHSVAL